MDPGGLSEVFAARFVMRSFLVEMLLAAITTGNSPSFGVPTLCVIKQYHGRYQVSTQQTSHSLTHSKEVSDLFLKRLD